MTVIFLSEGAILMLEVAPQPSGLVTCCMLSKSLAAVTVAAAFDWFLIRVPIAMPAGHDHRDDSIQQNQPLNHAWIPCHIAIQQSTEHTNSDDGSC